MAERLAVSFSVDAPIWKTLITHISICYSLTDVSMTCIIITLHVYHILYQMKNNAFEKGLCLFPKPLLKPFNQTSH